MGRQAAGQGSSTHPQSTELCPSGDEDFRLFPCVVACPHAAIKPHVCVCHGGCSAHVVQGMSLLQDSPGRATGAAAGMQHSAKAGSRWG